MRRSVAGLSMLAVATGLAVSVPAPAAANDYRTVTRDGIVLQHYRVAKATTPVKGTGPTRSDFDGDGVDDIAASADPSEHRFPQTPMGLVVVRYSSAPYVDYFATAVTPAGGCGCFGEILAAGDFNGDGYDDLAASDYGEYDLSAKANAGGVWVIPGSVTGLRLDGAKHFTQSTPGVPGASEEGDWFGSALAAGDINGDGRDDLAVGAYGEAIGKVTYAGAVAVLYGGANGLTGTGAQQLHQNQAAVPGSAERNDHFGWTLAIGRVNNNKYADLVIGAPGENEDSSPTGSGMLTLMWGSANGVKLSGATSVTGAALRKATGRDDSYVRSLGMALAIGDVNGDKLGEVIAGAPYTQSPKGNEGMVAVFTGRTGGAGLSSGAVKMFSQRTPGVPGSPEVGDLFGATLAVGDVTGDGRDDVLVGAPGEAIGTKKRAGTVALLKGSASGLTGTGAQGFDQDHPVVPGGAESNDQFGGAVAILNLDGMGPLDAIVTSPREMVGADSEPPASGSVALFHGGSGGLVPQSASWSGASMRTDFVWPKWYGRRLATAQSGGLMYH
ncbi:VCBS repeat-containing protein [Micromonospora fiedleri]|uniref:VCBS repeat-containing protein n=2 Tax=Micromonospora fiedleri TaxID=1157498 RepID=A0ABS1UR01_9ACTN|nr:VCBS repeat-containing protein [Micromonospora fiedleri]